MKFCKIDNVVADWSTGFLKPVFIATTFILLVNLLSSSYHRWFSCWYGLEAWP